MFGSNKKSNNSSGTTTPINSSNSVNTIVNGTQVEGKLVANNDIRVDGFIDGTLQCEGKVIIGKSGRIEGDVFCANAVIEGKFNGKLRVKELLHVKSTAYIDGEVKTGQLLVDPGGVINGSCEMGSQVKNISKDLPKADVGS